MDSKTVVEVFEPKRFTPVVPAAPKARMPKTPSAANRALSKFGTIGFEAYKAHVLRAAQVSF